MLRKNLDLILDAFLLVLVLGIAFWNSHARARLNPGESANPPSSGSYYRTPGVNGTWFGPELNSLTLCAGVHNPYNNRGQFDIVETIEMRQSPPQRFRERSIGTVDSGGVLPQTIRRGAQTTPTLHSMMI